MSDHPNSPLHPAFAALSVPINDNGTSAANNFIAPLSHYGFLAIAGADAAKFLQGQTTCDVSKVDAALSCAGAYTTPKGRMISSFQLTQSDAETYLLRMRADIVESTKAVFGKYIVFSKAEQQNASEDYIAIGLCGDQAKAAVSNAFAACPCDVHQVVNHQGNLALHTSNHFLAGITALGKVNRAGDLVIQHLRDKTIDGIGADFSKAQVDKL